jgi:riboflavin transporter FmnP
MVPAMMGMPVLTIDGASLVSLMGHLIYGLILGLAVAIIRRR